MLIILTAACGAIIVWALLVLKDYCKLKRIKPFIDEEGNVHPPERIYDQHTILTLLSISAAALTKGLYLFLALLDLYQVTTITYNQLISLEIFSVICLCGSLSTELDIWIKYQVRLKIAAKTSGQTEYV